MALMGRSCAYGLATAEASAWPWCRPELCHATDSSALPQRPVTLDKSQEAPLNMLSDGVCLATCCAPGANWQLSSWLGFLGPKSRSNLRTTLNLNPSKDPTKWCSNTWQQPHYVTDACHTRRVAFGTKSPGGSH